MSTQKIYNTVTKLATEHANKFPGNIIEHLDIGAGEGYLIQQMKSIKNVRSRACDFHVDRFKVDGVEITSVNIDAGNLPYQDESFDLITCSEVIEHIDNYRAFIRDAYRILKPGGLLILTTPNVLNCHSRVRYVSSGFASLFGPMPFKNEERHSTDWHITPIPYFYLAHALINAGFDGVSLTTDRLSRDAVAAFVILSPLMVFGWVWFLAQETFNYRTLTQANKKHVKNHMSPAILFGRTVITASVKP